ncbi:hypothetical protein AAFF_G00290510 [Aldrovandia affinis]|uniref:Uncharacterized protein n=1 Tax=Aldrovandia affinis TaxID=143900 RepID=A0AAD7R9D4_9TELE|nr:hypothetical protein AAFF_G00290510 [Aldrovandia affinis]
MKPSLTLRPGGSVALGDWRIEVEGLGFEGFWTSTQVWSGEGHKLMTNVTGEGCKWAAGQRDTSATGAQPQTDTD